MRRALAIAREAVTVGAFVFGICALAIGASMLGARSSAGAKPAHECVAPCTVIIGNRQEDEFGLDYGWRNRSTAVVDVYTDGCVPARLDTAACAGQPGG